MYMYIKQSIVLNNSALVHCSTCKRVHRGGREAYSLKEEGPVLPTGIPL